MTSNSQTSRRRFLITSGAIASSAVSATAFPLPAMAADSAEGWIDAHVHVWTPDVDSYPLHKDFHVSDMKPSSFTPEELFRHTRPSGVDRIVLIQMSYYQDDNRYMVDQIRKYPGVFSGVGIVDHRSSNLEEKMDELWAAKVRGLRLHPKANEAETWVSDPGMAKLWKHAAKIGMSACLLINPQDLVHAEAMCKKFGETRVVIDHFARIGLDGTIPITSLDSLCNLAKFPQVSVKTSAFYALGQKRAPYDDLIPMIKRVVDAFGPERLMWASDCPFQVQEGHQYEPSIALIRDRIDFLTDSEKRWLLRGTAEKIFFS